MKILEMNLIAFGPFTGICLDLSAGAQGLHIIYGPNEAGKSSALRALRQMLYGIPVRTDDAFLHPYGKLRIGGLLRHSDGTEIAFVRRKSRSKFLRAADDEIVLDDNALDPFLGGVEESHFIRMFGIGHEELVEGGREIVGGRGEIGQALFSAGSGLLKLKHVQDALLTEYNLLYKSGGKNPRINVTIASIRKTIQQQKEALLPAATWHAHETALKDAKKRIDRIQYEMDERLRLRGRLERIRQSLPLIARRRDVGNDLAALESLPRLADDFAARRIKMETRLQEARSDRVQREAAIEKDRGRVAALPVACELLAVDRDIEQIQQELGSYRKAAKDRPGLETRMKVLRNEATDLLANLGNGLAVKDTLLRPDQIAEIQDLGKAFERLTARLDTSRENERKLAGRLEVLGKRRSSLSVPTDTEPLVALVNQVSAAGPLEDLLRRERSDIESLKASLDNRLSGQTLWRGSADGLEKLPIPTVETIARFEEESAAIEKESERLATERAAFEKESVRTLSELAAIDLAQAVPTETDLDRARSLRDSGWALVRITIEGEDPDPGRVEAFCNRFDGEPGLADAFRTGIEAADDIADRLRREADRVNRRATLVADQSRYTQQLEGVTLSEKRLAAEQAALLERWRRVWTPVEVSPLSVREMRSWASNMRDLQEKRADLGQRQAAADRIEETIARHRMNLRETLEPLREKRGANAEPLADLLAISRRIIEDQRLLRSKIDTIEADIEERENELADTRALVNSLSDEMAQWRRKWALAVAPIGLSAEDSPAAAGSVIESIRTINQKMADAEVLRKRLDGMDRDAETFRKKIATLTSTAAPDLLEAPPERAAMDLYTRLTVARESISKRKTIEEHLEKEALLLRESDLTIARIEANLVALCRQAGVDRLDELPEVEARCRKREALENTHSEIENRLRMLSAGATVDDFVRDALTEEADTLDSQIESLTREIEALDKERSALDQTIGREKTELARMDGSARAAELAEETEHLLARLGSDVERYARLRIASAVLAGAIERYREKNQGPLLLRAGELFSRMTLNSFSGIRAEYDDRGNPVLVGVRADSGEPMNVEMMSDGSADQLYLALRLASLEHAIENSEPLPFTFDDILLRFDDERAAATLQILAELSRKTQILFFTHHRRLVELAERHIGAGEAFVQELS
jgi:uncharacterized protein YhaN